jgi:hypothetical protein
MYRSGELAFLVTGSDDGAAQVSGVLRYRP